MSPDISNSSYKLMFPRYYGSGIFQRRNSGPHTASTHGCTMKTFLLSENLEKIYTSMCLLPVGRRLQFSMLFRRHVDVVVCVHCWLAGMSYMILKWVASG